MDSTRQDRVSKLLQKEFGDIFVHYARQVGGVLIAVSEVRVSPDLSFARVFLSIFPNAKGDEIIDRIAADNKALRYELGRRMRHQLRIIPELDFRLDSTIEKMERIDQILKADEYLHVDLDDIPGPSEL